MNHLKRRPLSVTAVIPAALLLCLGACAGDEPAPSPAAEPAPAETTVASDSDPSAGAELDIAGIRFRLPAGWTNEQPSSPMRQGQASIPGSGGDGQLTIFFFGPGGGGGVDANLSRWVGQMTDAEGEPAREQFESGDLLVTTVRQQGTLRASTMGTFPSTDQPDYALYGAVVEGPGGPWFFKAIAPQTTMAEQADAFKQMLTEIEVSG